MAGAEYCVCILCVTYVYCMCVLCMHNVCHLLPQLPAYSHLQQCAHPCRQTGSLPWLYLDNNVCISLIHTHTHTHTHIYIHACICPCTCIFIHACIHTYTYANLHTYVYSCTHANIQTYKPAYINTCCLCCHCHSYV